MDAENELIINRIIKILFELNKFPKSNDNSEEEIFKANWMKATQSLQNEVNIFKELISKINEIEQQQTWFEWKHLCLNLHLLNALSIHLELLPLNGLSVQSEAKIKQCIKTIVTIYIQKKIQSSLPYSIQREESVADIDVIYKYLMLKCAVHGLCFLIKSPNLRLLVVPFLAEILVGVYQLSYCPLRKPEPPDPSTNTDDSNKLFVMTDLFYHNVLEDQLSFREEFVNLQQSVHPVILVKSTMLLHRPTNPRWLSNAIARNLNKVIRSQNGVQTIITTLMNETDCDQSQMWHTIQIILKLLRNCRKFDDFSTNICEQIKKLVDINPQNAKEHNYEKVFVVCTKTFEDHQSDFLEKIFRVFKLFLINTTQTNSSDSVCDITKEIERSVRVIHALFYEETVHSAPMEIHVINSLIPILFQLYTSTKCNTQFVQMNLHLKNICTRFFSRCDQNLTECFDTILFGFGQQLRTDITMEVTEKVLIKKSDITLTCGWNHDAFDYILDVLEDNSRIHLFGYLLHCICDKKTYFTSQNDQSLMVVEEDSPMLKRLLVVHKILSELADDKSLQEALKRNPTDIIKYFQCALSTQNIDTDLMVTILMLLEALIINGSESSWVQYRVLIDVLTTSGQNTDDIEVRKHCQRICSMLENEECAPKATCSTNSTKKSAFDVALEDLCDPLIPTRGHALITLTKLIHAKDEMVMEKRNYVLNLFLLHLKDEDSFIYLAAIQGLAGLADHFPDKVIEVLCEEYNDFQRKSIEGQEMRIKIGEVLTKTVRNLGEMAPQYKTLLLNTFLNGTRDDDHLQRSSALSNLGEMCRIMGYKLGTIVSEILSCVHAIICTDKAFEARRAAVTVIRGLFVGLGSDTLSFLKDEILPIYRTLKFIYHCDADDVMKLQAQLALEELNENIMSILSAPPQLNLEKKPFHIS